MRHFHGVLLRSVADQMAGGDDEPIDPAKVDISELPRLSWNFNTAFPPAGRITHIWYEDGQLLIEGELNEYEDGRGPISAGTLTPAANTTRTTVIRGQQATVRDRLLEVGMVRENRDSGLPPVVLEDE